MSHAVDSQARSGLGTPQRAYVNTSGMPAMRRRAAVAERCPRRDCHCVKPRVRSHPLKEEEQQRRTLPYTRARYCRVQPPHEQSTKPHKQQEQAPVKAPGGEDLRAVRDRREEPQVDGPLGDVHPPCTLAPWRRAGTPRLRPPGRK